MLESRYRRRISTELRGLGCIVVPVVGTAAGGSGYPDTYICSRHISCWIEFKGADTKLEDVQRKMLEDLRAHGELAYVLRYPGLLQHPSGETIAEISRGFVLLKWLRENHRKHLKL